MPTDKPQNWRLEIDPDRVDLYLELSRRPRPLTVAEARMMVELVDAWRALEQRKHIALSEGAEECKDDDPPDQTAGGAGADPI